MSEYFIREAKLGDAEGIHEAHMRSIREVCVKEHGEDEIKGWGNRTLDGRWTNAINRGHVWVVEGDGKIKGQAYIRIFEENSTVKAHIHGLYLTPEILGLGFGASLVQLMLEKARKCGVDLVTLESTITAHAFYQRMGFSDTGPMGRTEIAGHLVSYFPMEQGL